MNTEEVNSYCMKTYHKPPHLCTLTDSDIKLIHAISRFKQRYAEQINKRACVKFISFHECPSIQHSSTEPKIKNVVKQPSVTLICKATKMDGKPCTAKAKPNCNFCGRHLKSSS